MSILNEDYLPKKINYQKISTKIHQYSPKKRVIIAGKGGSGKDHLKNLLSEYSLKYCVSHTTRPPRHGEINGSDYYFVSPDEFEIMIAEGKFLEYVKFNGWYYGTSLEEFEKSTLLIMTPSGIKKLSSDLRYESFVIYIDIEEETRRSRLASRRDADDVERRLNADKEDFQDFEDYDGKIIVSDFTLETLKDNLILKQDEDKCDI